MLIKSVALARWTRWTSHKGVLLAFYFCLFCILCLSICLSYFFPQAALGPIKEQKGITILRVSLV